MEILHLTHRSDWAAALRSGSYRVSTRGRTLDEVGYIHCSLPEQLAGVAAVVHAGDDEPLVVLVLDTDRIIAAGVEVRFEDGGAGQDFPHVYGPIDPHWVTAVRPARISRTGGLLY